MKRLMMVLLFVLALAGGGYAAYALGYLPAELTGVIAAPAQQDDTKSEAEVAPAEEAMEVMPRVLADAKVVPVLRSDLAMAASALEPFLEPTLLRNAPRGDNWQGMRNTTRGLLDTGAVLELRVRTIEGRVVFQASDPNYIDPAGTVDFDVQAAASGPPLIEKTTLGADESDGRLLSCLLLVVVVVVVVGIPPVSDAESHFQNISRLGSRGNDDF